MAPAAVEPGDSGDDVIRAFFLNGNLARVLGEPVDALRAAGNVEFGIGAIGVAREDVVGGDGDQTHVVTAAGGRNVPRTQRIDGKGEIFFRLALVDLRHGSKVKHYVGLMPSNENFNSLRGRNVSICSVCRNEHEIGF